MTITTTATKRKRGLGSLLNQFGNVGGAMPKAASAVAEHATKAVRQLPVESSFVERLNSMIAAGASFDISTDDFQVVGAGFLSNAETTFLHANKPEVLCTLQQSALKKYLSPSDLQMFKDETKERAAILSDGENLEPPFEILQSITKEWFVDVLEEMFEKG